MNPESTLSGRASYEFEFCRDISMWEKEKTEQISSLIWRFTRIVVDQISEREKFQLLVRKKKLPRPSRKGLSVLILPGSFPFFLTFFLSLSIFLYLSLSLPFSPFLCLSLPFSLFLSRIDAGQRELYINFFSTDKKSTLHTICYDSRRNVQFVTLSRLTGDSNESHSRTRETSSFKRLPTPFERSPADGSHGISSRGSGSSEARSLT